MEKMRNKPRNLLGKYNRLVYSTDKQKFCNICLSPNSQKKKVWNCNFGWLLVSEEQATASYRSYQFCVWNPESSKVIDLPLLNLEPKQIIGSGTLLSRPGNPGSMVLLFEDFLKYLICYRFDDKQWTKIWLAKEVQDIGQYDDTDTIAYFTHCDGKLYAATGRKNYLMVIEENRFNDFTLTPLNCRLPMISSPCYYINEHLLDVWGQLCAVQISWGGVNHQDVVDVEVSKLESSGNGMEWVRMESAEDQAFFLSGDYAFSCPTNETEIQGSHVYLFRFKRLYSINIKDKSFSVSLSLRNFSGSGSSPFLAMRDLIRLYNLQAKPQHIVSKEKEEIVIENGNEAQAYNLGDLPFDVLELIASKLYLVDYNNFRSVCNTFRLAGPYIKWREASLEFQSETLFPWLTLPGGNSDTSQNFIDPHLGGRYLINVPNGLSNGTVRYSKDGWLLICNSNFMFCYHPFRKRLIELPQQAGHHYYCLGYGLSSSPTLDDSILVGSSFYAIYYLCLRDGIWFERQFPDYFDFQPNNNSPIYFDGAFYFLGRDGKLGVFELNRDQVSWKILRDLKSPCDGFCYNYLLECGGNLLSVFVVDQLVNIYRLNFTTVMDWERVTSLGNHALFVSPSSSFSVTGNSSGMENKVYFHKLFGMDIVYYCLSTNKFYTCGSKEVVADFKNTIEFASSTWIEPKWPRLQS